MVEIRKARNLTDIAEAKSLIDEFFSFLMERYPERRALLDAYLLEQDMEKQLAKFSSYFIPPSGECLLASVDGAVVGTVMLRNLKGALCEMNRMYVRPEARGFGVGRALCNALITEAKVLGYQKIRLDAWERHWESLPLYESLGFTPEADDPDADPLRVRLHLKLQETEI